MSIDTATQTLTADDVKALRKAEKVVFRLLHGVATIEAGIGKMLCDNRRYTDVERRLFPDRAYGSSDRERTVTVSGVATNWYADKPVHEGLTGFEMLHTAQHNATWQTIAGLLRAGDALHLHFDGDAHTNENLRKAGMHGDVLRLVVHRGETKMTFMVTSSAGPDNSARMVHA